MAENVDHGLDIPLTSTTTDREITEKTLMAIRDGDDKKLLLETMDTLEDGGKCLIEMIDECLDFVVEEDDKDIFPSNPFVYPQIPLMLYVCLTCGNRLWADIAAYIICAECTACWMGLT